MPEFAVGDRATKNPEAWVADDFDGWGRGVGIGIVVKSPIPLGDEDVDVRWPYGRCFERVAGILEGRRFCSDLPAHPAFEHAIRVAAADRARRADGGRLPGRIRGLLPGCRRGAPGRWPHGVPAHRSPSGARVPLPRLRFRA